MKKVYFLTLMILILSVIGAAAQMEPFKSNYVGGWVPSVEEGRGDNQMVFQISQAFEMWEVWDLFTVEGAYTQTSKGLINEESAPFLHTFSPQTWLKYPLYAAADSTFQVDALYGWMHDSTGVAGEGSEGIERHFLRTPFSGKFRFKDLGLIQYDIQPTFWQIFADSESPQIRDVRGIGGSAFGWEVWGRVEISDKMLIDFEADKSRVMGTIGINTIPGAKNWYTTLILFNGAGMQLASQESEKGIGLGMTFVPN